MANYSDFKDLTISSIKENIKAIEFCISFDKSVKENWDGDDKGCLGIPASILLCSIIDTMGSYFRGSSATIMVNGESKSINTVSDHFLILNHDKLFNLNLTGKAIYDFYSKYRSPLTHNNTLPENTTLAIGSDTDNIFIFNSAGEIIQVNLLPLFIKIKLVSETFIYFLNTAKWSEDHKLSQDLQTRKNESRTGLNPTNGPTTGITNSTSSI